MNFFGHAHVARAVSDEPAFVLGAMLPDFAAMCRVRIPTPDHDALAAGIALHHRTDDAFHGCPEFVALAASASSMLEPLGIPRGAARAIGHVGVELLLDAILLEDGATRAAYLRAIDALGDPAVTASLRVEGRGAARWPEFVARMRGAGTPAFDREPERVADRLIALLASRPRLAVGGERRGQVARALSAIFPALERDADRLVLAARARVIESVPSK